MLRRTCQFSQWCSMQCDRDDTNISRLSWSLHCCKVLRRLAVWPSPFYTFCAVRSLNTAIINVLIQRAALVALSAPSGTFCGACRGVQYIQSPSLRDTVMRYTSALLTSSAEPICKQQHGTIDQLLQGHERCRPMPAVVVNSVHDSKDISSNDKVGTLPTRQVNVAAPSEAGTLSARWGGRSVKTIGLDPDNAQSISSRWCGTIDSA